MYNFLQVDYLQQANRDLEKKMAGLEKHKSDSSNTCKELKDRNDELCMELAAMNKVYKSLGKEKKKGEAEIDAQLTRIEVDVEEKKQAIVELQSNLHNVKKV